MYNRYKSTKKKLKIHVENPCKFNLKQNKKQRKINEIKIVKKNRN